MFYLVSTRKERARPTELDKIILEKVIRVCSEDTSVGRSGGPFRGSHNNDLLSKRQLHKLC